MTINLYIRKTIEKNPVTQILNSYTVRGWGNRYCRNFKKGMKKLFHQ
jgi:hypothetical protein